MEVAILGCGPAGLLAAEALVQQGHSPTIFSKKVKSQMFGAMFLHVPIPEVTPPDPEYTIQVVKVGTREGYAKLVYGDPAHPVSWDVIPSGPLRGWNLKKAYDVLWDRYQGIVHDREIGAADILDIEDSFQVVYSSIPLRSICREGHEFTKQDIWIIHGDGKPHLIHGVNDVDMMYYNGYPPDGSVEQTEGFDWYRFSQLDSYQAWEHSSPPNDDWNDDWYQLSTGEKPISTDCDCWGGVRHIGRFGRWERGVLTHHTFNAVTMDAQARWGYALQ
jgi:hypothetical protein